MSITGLLVSSLLLILVSAVALVFGWVNASEPLVVTSICFSAASAVFLAMSLYRSSPRRVAAAPPRNAKTGARAGRSGR